MKYKIVFYSIFLSLLLSICKVEAQTILTLEEAVSITLKNNYDIRLVSNNLDISKTNVSLANSGAFPVVTGNFSNNNSIVTTRQTQSNGQIREANDARNSNLAYGPVLNWTVFDGFGMFARYEQLKELQKVGESNLKLSILTNISDVVSAYYNLVQIQQQIKANLTTIEISRLRLNTAQIRFELGKAARLEVLNAQVDLNTDTTHFLRQQVIHRSTQIRINELLARDINIPFSVIDTVIIDKELSLEQLSASARQQNPALQIALINRRIAELNLKQVRALRYPFLTLNTGYNFNASQSALGFATSSTARGLNYGATASINIFNGFLQKRNEKIAGIQIDNARLQYEKLNQNVHAQLASAYQNYLTSLALVKLEEDNQEIASRNLSITLEKYRLGSITPVEFREAQRNYLDAKVRFSNAQYQAKLAEIVLKEIAGNLDI